MVLLSSLGYIFFEITEKFFQLVNEPAHLIIEAVLAIFILYLLLHKSYKIKEKATLSHEVIEELIEQWQPEPLVSPKAIEEIRENEELNQTVVISSGASPYVNIEGRDEQFLNLSSLGVLNFQMNPEVIESAEESLRTYGVGSCGPRGFYGTIDVHLRVEEEIANFMNTDAAVLYSAGFATISSVIPAFAKPGDVLIVDKGICFSAQTGITLSRANVKWFNHNDMQDLKRNLDSIQDIFKAAVRRVFVIIEGIYENSYDIAPLDQIMELKKQYPFRLIIEESYSIGVLGNTGRGITEHFNIPTKDVEIICASIGNALGAIGGFSCGSESVCSHQRLNSSGYVFSCSLPPYISSATIKAIQLLRKKEEIQKLKENIQFLHEELKELKSLAYSGAKESPFVYLKLHRSSGDLLKDEKILQEIVDKLREEYRIILTRSRRSKKEKFPTDPSIKLAVSSALKKEEIQMAISSIEQAAKSVSLP